MSSTALEIVCRTIDSPQMREKVQQALPKGVDLDRFTRTTLTAIQQNPSILECDKTSLYNAVVRCAQDGLLPDGREAVLTAFNTKVGNEWVKKATCMPMVYGVIKQLGKAGIHAYAASVYEGEPFEVWSDETGLHLKHTRDPFAKARNLVGVYAVARTKDGETYVETLNVEEIEKIRKSSKSPDRGPWVEWFDRMGQKSALHRVAKRIPTLDPDLADALRREDEALAPEPAQEAPKRSQAPHAPRVLEQIKAEPAPAPAPVEATAPVEDYAEGEVL